MDENGHGLQNVTVDFWQVEEVRMQPPYYLREVWTPSIHVNGFLETSVTTNANGFFNATLGEPISWSHEYRLYIYTQDHRYVPLVRFLGKSPEAFLGNFTAQLTPAASYIFDNDVLIADSTTPWQSIAQLVFQVSPSSKDCVRFFSDPIDSYFGEGHSCFLGLEPRRVIVPADTSVEVTVVAVRSYDKDVIYHDGSTIYELVPQASQFKIDQLPILKQGQILHVDMGEYVVQYNLQATQNLLQEVESSLEQAQGMGFFISAEKHDLAEAQDLLISAEEKYAEGSYADSYVNILYAYQIATKLSQRISAMYPEAAASAAFFPLFFAFTAVAVASLLFESEKLKALFALGAYVFLFASFYYLYPGSRIADLSILIGSSIGYIGIVLVLALVLPRLVKEKVSEGRVALGSTIAALFSLAKRNIRRRRLRFILSLVVVTVSITAFVALTSLSTEYGLLVRKTSQSLPVEGLLVRSANAPVSLVQGYTPFTPMREADIAWLADRNGTVLVAPRLDNTPKRVIRYVSQVEIREYQDPLGSLNSSSLTGKIFFSVVGIVPSAEASTTRLDSIVKMGRYLTDNESNAILLSEKAANDLGVQVGDELVWYGRRAPTGTGADRVLSFKLVGILGDSSLDDLRDLDGQRFLYMCQKQLEEHVQLDGAHVRESALQCSPDEVIITTYQNACCFSDSVFLSRVNVLMNTPDNILPLARELAIMRNFKVWASIGESLYFYVLGSSVEIGGSGIVIALIIVALTIGVAMSASVYERRHEMKILSAVGLNPSHITMLFVDQAIIIGLVGGAFGYLLGMSLYQGFLLFPTDIIVRQKLSLGWSLVALAVGIGVTTVGAAIPAIKASVLATPSLLRQWKIEKAPSSVGEPYVFEMPVKVEKENIDHFVSYLIKRLQEYEQGEPFRLKSIKRTSEETPQERLIHVRFTYHFSLQLFSFLATNDVAVTIEGGEDVGTVQLSSKGAGPDEMKHIRRIAGLVRNIVYEWSSRRPVRR